MPSRRSHGGVEGGWRPRLGRVEGGYNREPVSAMSGGGARIAAAGRRGGRRRGRVLLSRFCLFIFSFLHVGSAVLVGPCFLYPVDSNNLQYF
jgi:hypothetical protein